MSLPSQTSKLPSRREHLMGCVHTHGPRPRLGFVALWRVACGCDACKEQLGMLWLPGVNMYEQPRYAANDRCVLRRSYKEANDWKIFQLEPVNEEEEKGARDSIRCGLSCNGRASHMHCKRMLREYGGLSRQEQWWLMGLIVIGFSEYHIGTLSRRKQVSSR